MHESNKTPLIEAKGLFRKINSSRYILNNVDFTLKLGTKTAVVGRSGSGKSTLLRALIGLDPIDQGELLWNGSPPTPLEIPAIRRKVIYLQQNPAFIEGTVEENLRLPFELASKTTEFHLPTVTEYLSALRFADDFLSTNASSLSGGEAQVVAVLRAIQLDPQALLLDEPTASLDTTTKATVETLIDSWCETDPSRSFVWVTHDLNQAKAKCEEIFTMEEGVLTKEESA